MKRLIMKWNNKIILNINNKDKKSQINIRIKIK